LPRARRRRPARRAVQRGADADAAAGRQGPRLVANRLIETYDLKQGKQVESWSGPDQDIASLAFSPDGEFGGPGRRRRHGADLECHQHDRLLKDKDKKDIDLKAHDEWQSPTLAFTPDKKPPDQPPTRTAKIKIWDLANQQTVKTIPALKQPIVATAMSPDGKRFAMATMDNVLRVFGVADGKVQRELADAWRRCKRIGPSSAT